MDTSQMVTREDRITSARQSCMMQLGRKYENSTIEQEKHERNYPQVAGEREIHKGSFLPSFGIRVVFGVLFFLFVFWVRENQISYQKFDYAFIREQILDNHMIEKAEECVQLYWNDIQQDSVATKN